jgi:hypothetical protein
MADRERPPGKILTHYRPVRMAAAQFDYSETEARPVFRHVSRGSRCPSEPAGSQAEGAGEGPGPGATGRAALPAALGPVRATGRPFDSYV